jgi:hypothetical protein
MSESCEQRADELQTLRCFMHSICDMSITAPSGENQSVYFAKRLREIRNAARHWRDHATLPAPIAPPRARTEGGE